MERSQACPLSDYSCHVYSSIGGSGIFYHRGRTYLKIGFGSVANEFVYYLFGPVLGVVYGCLLDLVKFVAKPTGAFFPGFTMVTMLAALIYGTFSTAGRSPFPECWR